MSETYEFELVLLARLAGEESERQGPSHPTAARLTAYHESRLPAREMEELQDHLMLCRDCVQHLVELRCRLDAEKRGRFFRERCGQPAGPRPPIVVPSWVLVDRLPGVIADQRIENLGPPPGMRDRRRPSGRLPRRSAGTPGKLI